MLPNMRLLPESLAIGHKFATNVGHQNTSAFIVLSARFRGTKNVWNCSWRPIFRAKMANLCDNAYFLGDVRRIEV